MSHGSTDLKRASATDLYSVDRSAGTGSVRHLRIMISIATARRDLRIMISVATHNDLSTIPIIVRSNTPRTKQ
jgi:hypothetical protein